MIGSLLVIGSCLAVIDHWLVGCLLLVVGLLWLTDRFIVSLVDCVFCYVFLGGGCFLLVTWLTGGYLYLLGN